MKKMNFKDKQKITEKTFHACVAMLKETRKAFLVRSTGFGKTYIGSELAKTRRVTGKKWSKVVFVVPLRSIEEGIKQKYAETLKNINYEFVTYQALAYGYKIVKTGEFSVEEVIPELAEMDEGLFIFEEAHKFGYKGDDRVGTNKSSKFIAKILERYPKAYYFGSTATPYRMDGADMAYTFFEGNIVFPYTVNDAIDDGFYRKPNYVSGNIDIVGLERELSENIENARTLTDKQKKNEYKRLDAELTKYANIFNMPEVIRDSVNETDCPKNYMRFLIFFSSHKVLNARFEDVKAWFGEAFPNMKIRVTQVTSLTYDDSEDEYGRAVYDLDKEEGTLDLILTINKLAMGYHDSSITGVMLMRLTASNIMYRQIIGRCYDMEIEHQTVIMDITGNYDFDTGKLMKTGKPLEESGSGRNKDGINWTKYTGFINRSCVEYSKKNVDVDEIKRTFDYDRIQQERELVWCYKNKIFDEVFCAKELNIDVDAWANVLRYHSDITGTEEHESI